MSYQKRVEIQRSINRRIEQIRKVNKVQASLSGTADLFAKMAERKTVKYGIKHGEEGWICDRCEQPLRSGHPIWRLVGRFGVTPHDQFNCPGPQAAAQTGK